MTRISAKPDQPGLDIIECRWCMLQVHYIILFTFVYWWKFSLKVIFLGGEVWDGSGIGGCLTHILHEHNKICICKAITSERQLTGDWTTSEKQIK